jgi:hypothetical protein
MTMRPVYLIRFADGTFQSSPSGRVTNPELAACWREIEKDAAVTVAGRLGGEAVLYGRNAAGRLAPVVLAKVLPFPMT